MASFVKEQGYDLHHFPPPCPSVGVGSPHVARPIEDTASFPLNTPINLWHTDNGVKCSLKDEKQIQQIFCKIATFWKLSIGWLEDNIWAQDEAL